MTKSSLIILSATKDAVEDFKSFGKIQYVEDSGDYWLVVDPRYDFAEVVAYIEGYG